LLRASEASAAWIIGVASSRLRAESALRMVVNPGL
jgi:hypothetical protein